MDAARFAVGSIFHRHLALGVGTQVGHKLALAIICHMLSAAADGGKFLKDLMREAESEGHIVLGFIHCITEHHSLVAGALKVLLLGERLDGGLACHATAYVLALLVDGGKDSAGIAVEAICATVIADAVDHIAGDTMHIHICFRGYLPGYHHLTGGDQCLYRHAAARVAGYEFVYKTVAYLVGDLVGMSFGYGLRRKEIILIVHFLNLIFT